jgi:hypothetical protein
MNRNFSLLKSHKTFDLVNQNKFNFKPNLFYSANLVKKNFGRDFHYEKDIEKKLKEKFENKNSQKLENASAQYANIRFDVIIDYLIYKFTHLRKLKTKNLQIF